MRRGPISRGAFDATIDIARGAVEGSPFYDADQRRIALHIIQTIENGVVNIARVKPRVIAPRKAQP